MVQVIKTNTKTPAVDGIPPMLDRRNGAANDRDALLARIAELEAQVARKTTLTLKVSQAGPVSLYGMGRFPDTLYAQQWEKVLGMADDIRAFIEANNANLSTK